MTDTIEQRLESLAGEHASLARLREDWNRTPPGSRRRACAEALAEAVAADGCTVYGLHGSELAFEIVLSRSLGLGGGYQSGPIDFPSIRMRRVDGSVDESSLAVRAAHREQTIHIADVASDLGPEAARTLGFDRVMGYETRSILTVPIVPDGDDVRGVLQLVNATDESGAAVAFDARRIALAEAVADLMAALPPDR